MITFTILGTGAIIALNRPSDRVRGKIKIVGDFGGKLCVTKS